MTAPFVDEHGRPEPPRAGDETSTLIGFLDFLRDTMRWKTEGLTDEQLLCRPVDVTSMTLGGMLKHLAFVEDHWFHYVLVGQDFGEPWASVDWRSDPDWDWHSAEQDTGEELRELWSAAVERSRGRVRELLSSSGSPLDTPVQREVQGPMTARWILTHMIEEYARHCGHADLLREAIDGETGE